MPTPPSIVSSLVALCISVASFESVSGLFRPGSLRGLKQSASCRNDQFIWDAAISSELLSPPRWRDLGPSHRPASFQPASHRSKMTCHIIGHDGKITSFRAFVCNNDADATVWAKQMVDGHDVELWSGDRCVTLLNSTGKRGAVSHEVMDGRMVPKPAK